MMKARKMRWEHLECFAEEVKCIEVLFGKPQGKKLLGICIHGRKGIVKIDIKETGKMVT